MPNVLNNNIFNSTITMKSYVKHIGLHSVLCTIEHFDYGADNESQIMNLFNAKAVLAQ